VRANVVSKLDIDVLVHVATFGPAGATVPRLPRTPRAARVWGPQLRTALPVMGG
jgi:hypothetical protein